MLRSDSNRYVIRFNFYGRLRVPAELDRDTLETGIHSLDVQLRRDLDEVTVPC